MIQVKIVNEGKQQLPQYATAGSAGMDLRADIDKPIVLKPLERKLIPTGLKIALPVGYEAQIRPRSGLAIKYGVTVLNSPGTIDADYRGEIMVSLHNHGTTEQTIDPNERIAQMVVTPFIHCEYEETDNIDDTERGAGGFGSTGRQ